MREARRKKALDQIDKLEKSLRNIGFLGAEIEGVNVSVNEFLHTLYHAIKRSGKEENADGPKKCNVCGKVVNSSVVYNEVRVCEDCVRSRKLWLMIPDDDLREAGWIV